MLTISSNKAKKSNSMHSNSIFPASIEQKLNVFKSITVSPLDRSKISLRTLISAIALDWMSYKNLVQKQLVVFFDKSNCILHNTSTHTCKGYVRDMYIAANKHVPPLFKFTQQNFVG